VVAVVDASGAEAHFRPSQSGSPPPCHAEFLQQIAMADRLLLNKIDCVEETNLEGLERALRAVNPTAPIIRSQNAAVSLDAVLNMGAYECSEPLPQALDETAKCECEHSHDGSPCAHHASHGVHWLAIASQPGMPVALRDFELALNEVLTVGRLPSSSHDCASESGVCAEVLRIKGELYASQGGSCAACPQVMSLQGVRDTYELRETPVAWASRDTVQPASRLVVVGRHLHAVDWQRLFVCAPS
jgi:G3E family GTPase